ncbi:L antigen family member 3-like [Syngnathoides biaculeatus]|uniref:L antigen family member 3-like n=1 Tax=Syngnathoides biaculeatus TaxID=300417 RepID=UPI002ADD5B42|nr:L antigen family member 3-like [Syngnathoides biaculeatus]
MRTTRKANNMAAPENDERVSKFELSLDVPFPSSREAAIALRSLNPDREPRRGGIHKRLTLAGSVLSVKWGADEARILRVSVNSFLEHLGLVLETMHAFPTEDRDQSPQNRPRAPSNGTPDLAGPC